jgi:hypothetical protein
MLAQRSGQKVKKNPPEAVLAQRSAQKVKRNLPEDNASTKKACADASLWRWLAAMHTWIKALDIFRRTNRLDMSLQRSCVPLMNPTIPIPPVNSKGGARIVATKNSKQKTKIHSIPLHLPTVVWRPTHSVPLHLHQSVIRTAVRCRGSGRPTRSHCISVLWFGGRPTRSPCTSVSR